MAHHFESGVYFGRSAWHGLGTTLADGDERRRSVPGTIAAAGLDWDVDAYPLSVAHADRVPLELRGIDIDDRFAIFRRSDASYLGSVGADYCVLQNRQMFGWFQPFLDAGACEFETAGSLKEGRIVWILARLCQDDLIVRPGDAVRPYLLLSSSHDGSMATRVGFSPIRVECHNLLTMAHQVADAKLMRVKHTKNQHEALEAVRDTMDLVNAEFRATAEQYQALADLGISETQLAKYACGVLGINPENKDQQVSTQKRNQLQRIVALALDGIGQGRTALTAWDAYNGLTQWITHERQRDASKRVQSMWFGDSAQLNRKAFDLALALAN